MTRTVIVASAISLADLHEVISAAFDFNGFQDHEFRPDHPLARDHFDPAEEASINLPNLLVDPHGSASYYYGSDERWVIRIESLGFPFERMLVPKLIDATGPDVVEGCGGPEQMSEMREAAVRALAAVDLDLAAADMIASFLPGLHPHQVAQRLGQVDSATIASRVSFAIMPRYEDGIGPDARTHGDGTPTDPFSDPEEWPVPWVAEENGSAPVEDEVPERLPEDHSRAELGEETIREIRDALKDIPNLNFKPGALPEDQEPEGAGQRSSPGSPAHLPELQEPEALAITESIRWFLDFVGEGRPLTQAGYLKPADVREIAKHIEAEKYWIGKMNRESETVPVLLLREVMAHFRLIHETPSRVFLSPIGEQYRDQPLALAKYLAAALPLLHEPAEYPDMRRACQDLYQGKKSQEPLPPSFPDNRLLLLIMNVIERDADTSRAMTLTESGRAFLAAVLHSPEI